MNLRQTTEKVGQFLILLLIVTSAVELAFFFWVRSHVNLYSSGDPFPVPSGYLLDNSYMTSKSARCYLLRVSSDGCPYCRQDQPQYTRLVEQARKAGCESVILAPIAGQMELRENSPSAQLQYVDMSMGRVLKPFMTPETILLGGRGRPAWQQVGSMDDDALARALKALRRLR